MSSKRHTGARFRRRRRRPGGKTAGRGGVPRPDFGSRGACSAKGSGRPVAEVSLADRDLDLLEPAPFPNDADIFTDALGPGLRFFEPFSGSKQTAYSVDTNESFRGSSSIRIEVPAPGDPYRFF